MLRHRIATYHGQTPGPNGTSVHAYKATCGHAIYAVHVFKPGQEVTVGAAPHVHCGKCFKGVTIGEAAPAAVDLPNAGDLGHTVTDEHGRPARTIVEDPMAGRSAEPGDMASVTKLKVVKTIVEDPMQGREIVEDGMGG